MVNEIIKEEFWKELGHSKTGTQNHAIIENAIDFTFERTKRFNTVVNNQAHLVVDFLIDKKLSADFMLWIKENNKLTQ